MDKNMEGKVQALRESVEITNRVNAELQKQNAIMREALGKIAVKNPFYPCPSACIGCSNKPTEKHEDWCTWDVARKALGEVGG